MKKIGIVMGSDSDLPVVEKAMATLEKFGVPFEAHVYSAHRTPVEASEFAKGARANQCIRFILIILIFHFLTALL